MYCYMFRPCRVIIRHSLHEYVTFYWIVVDGYIKSTIYSNTQHDAYSKELLDVIAQKIEHFVTAAVRTSDPAILV
jgi:hypothetical protein